MQDQRLTQNLSLRQEQTLSATQIQSLDILMAPVLELQTKINHELETNPVLEQEELTPTNSDELTANEYDGIDESENASGNDEVIHDKSLFESGRMEAEDLSDDNSGTADFDLDRHGSMISRNQNFTYSGDEEKRDHFFSSLLNCETIQDDLISQLNFLALDEKLNELCRLIIGSLDEQGFFKGALDDLAVIAGVGVEETVKALELVKKLDPPGIGARDVKESLLLQLRRKGLDEDIYENLITLFFEEIAGNQLIQISKKTGESAEKIKECIAEIKKLNPYPYSQLTNVDESIFIVPELRIEEEEEGKYVAVFEKQYQPRLKISDQYIEMLYSANYSSEAKEYIKQKIQSANNIIKSIEQRRDTIRKIVEVIIDTQYDFFKNGNMHLKPLTMKQIADKIGMHETTVSRAVANKFAKTPQGIITLKYFFSAGFQSADGDMISSRGVMEKIRNIIDDEDKSSPCSDDDITKVLNDEGIPVARRTVAKYREELGILSSRMRKELD